MKKMKKTEFSKEQYDLAYKADMSFHWWTQARNLVLLSRLRELDHEKLRVMEVGCGKGFVVDCLRSKGIDCLGVELADVEVSPRVSEFIFTDIDACELNFKVREHVNVILMLDVIEHIEDVDSFIKNVVSAYPNVSDIIISVPARYELWSNYDEFYGHFRRYIKSDFDFVSDILVLTESSYFFHLLYLPMILIKKIKKNRSVDLIGPSEKSRFAHKLVSYLMYMDYKFFPSSLPGSSLIATFKVMRNKQS